MPGPPQPPPPQGQPPGPGGPPPDQGGGDPNDDDGGGGIGQVIVETDKNLAQLAQAAPPEFADKFKAVSDAFRAVVQAVMQKMGGGQGGPPPTQGPQDPQAAGNPNAKPAGY